MIYRFAVPVCHCADHNVSFDFLIFFDRFISEWVGDLDSENAGRLGLWQVCQRDETSDNCQKQLADFLSIPSIPFQVIVFLLAACRCKTFTFLNNNLTMSFAPSFRCHPFLFLIRIKHFLLFAIRNAFVSFFPLNSFNIAWIVSCEIRWQRHLLDYRLWQLCSQFYF